MGGRRVKIPTLTILLTLMLFACGKNVSEEPTSNLDNVLEKDRIYSALIGNDPYRLVTAGDALTFVGLYASAKKWKSLYKHMYDNTWHRNVYEVYPDESRSGISLEGMLSAINFLISMNDVDGIKQIYQYGQDNDWIFGVGPEEYTQLPQLEYLLQSYCESNLTGLEFPSFEGYKGNVIGLWVATKGRLYGYIRDAEITLVERLISAEPSNPIYHTILHRYTDGDHSKAVSILSNDKIFPPDRLPSTPLDLFAWNDAPSAILFVWTVFLMEN